MAKKKKKSKKKKRITGNKPSKWQRPMAGELLFKVPISLLRKKAKETGYVLNLKRALEHIFRENMWDENHSGDTMLCPYCESGRPASIVSMDDEDWEEGSVNNYYDCYFSKKWCVDCAIKEVAEAHKISWSEARAKIEAQLRKRWVNAPSPMEWCSAEEFSRMFEGLDFVDMRPMWTMAVKAHEDELADLKKAEVLEKRLASLEKARAARDKKRKASYDLVDLVERTMKKGKKKAAKRHKKYKISTSKVFDQAENEDVFIL